MEIFHHLQDRGAEAKTAGLSDLFDEQAARTPQNIALVFQGQDITYTELRRRSGILGRHLTRTAETGPGVVIGILLEPSIDMMVAILAVLKTRSAYLPIDPGLPVERQLFLLQEARISTLITQEGFENRMATAACKLLYVDRFDLFERDMTEWEGVSEGAGSDVACVLFTSGSTGKPKGVMIGHNGIIRLARDANFLKMREEDRVLNVLNYAFDGSLYNFFSTLLAGATLYLIHKDLLLNLKQFSAYIRRHKISILNLTTAFFNLIVDQEPACFAGLRKVLFGGERVSLNHTRRFFSTYGAGRLIHVYGPTENTTFSTFFEVNSIPEDALTIPIGKPVSGSVCFVLDGAGCVVDEGQPGELVVGGSGLALGYLGNPALWKAKLMPHPYAHRELVYRTGDLARVMPGGDLEFIGRFDNQVKIRGFRVELEEVEMALSEAATVQEIKITSLEGTTDRTLIAFLLPTAVFDFDEFMLFAKKRLPEYMVPGIFYRVKEFPFTENGKIDLRSMLNNRNAYPVITSGHLVAGENNLQNRLLGIWKKILDREELGIEDDFFKSGGNSIKAIQLLSEVEKQIAAVGRLEQLYKYPTVKAFSEFLKGKSDNLHIKYFVSLNRFVPGNNNFFIVPSSWGEENDFNSVAHEMDGSANFFKLQIPGLFEDKQERSLPKLAERFVKKILRIPAGVCDFIIGYSWGCFLAYEVTKQLEKKGRNMRLFLFDSDPAFEIDRSEIRFDRYDFFTLESIAEYLPHVKTQEELDRLKRFWMNNNTIHADYSIKDTIRSDIYAFEALDYGDPVPPAEEKKRYVLKQKADMQLWEVYTSGGFMNYRVKGNHDSIIRVNHQFITDIFSEVSSSTVS